MKPLFLEWVVSNTLRDFKMCEKAMELCKEEERREKPILIIFVLVTFTKHFQATRSFAGHENT